MSRSLDSRNLCGSVIEAPNNARLPRALALALLVQCVASSCTRVQEEEAAEPEVAARAGVLTAIRSGDYLARGNVSARLPMTSTTKIMVALVALQEADL